VNDFHDHSLTSFGASVGVDVCLSHLVFFIAELFRYERPAINDRESAFPRWRRSPLFTLRLGSCLHGLKPSIVSPRTTQTSVTVARGSGTLDRRERVQERIFNIMRQPLLVGSPVHHVTDDFPGLFQ
jgi:hypothetical protein